MGEILNQQSLAEAKDRLCVFTRSLITVDGNFDLLRQTAQLPHSTVLDVGCGRGGASLFFALRGKAVTGLKLANDDVYPEHVLDGRHPAELFGQLGVRMLLRSFETLPETDRFDLIWMSHMLEHTLDVGRVLAKARRLLTPEGYLCVLVPPFKSQVVMGHVSVGWNIGLLMHALLVSGFDVKRGHFIRHGYNICAFVRPSDKLEAFIRDDKTYDERSVYCFSPPQSEQLWPFPATQGFEGDLERVNWFDAGVFTHESEFSIELEAEALVNTAALVPAVTDHGKPFASSHDRFRLLSGERQVASSISGIRFDHVARYEYASGAVRKYLTRAAQSGGDVFCGVGYGTRLLAIELGCPVLGVDASSEAIEYAKQNYSTPSTIFTQKTFPFALPRCSWDFVTAIESLEHIADARRFLLELCQTLRPGGILIVTTPNEDQNSLARNPNPFHVRHYRPEELIQLMTSVCPEMVLRARSAQNVYRMEAGVIAGVLPDKDQIIRDDAAGQFTIYVFEKAADPAPQTAPSRGLAPVYANFSNLLVISGATINEGILSLRVTLKAPTAAAYKLLVHGHDTTGKFYNWDCTIDPPVAAWQPGDTLIINAPLHIQRLAEIASIDIGFFDEADAAGGWPALPLTTGERALTLDKAFLAAATSGAMK